MIGNINEMLEAFESGECDLTENGKCTECGSCCARLLPMAERELHAIEQYVKKHGVKTCRHGILLKNPVLDMTCPFLDESRKTEKCRIYEVRPLICKLYKCNKEYDKEAEKQFWDQKNTVVDMWDVFGSEDTGMYGELPDMK